MIILSSGVITRSASTNITYLGVKVEFADSFTVHVIPEEHTCISFHSKRWGDNPRLIIQFTV